MNRDQWYALLDRHHVVQDEINRLIDHLTSLNEYNANEIGELLEGLVMCCAVVASQIDQTRKDAPNV